MPLEDWMTFLKCSGEKKSCQPRILFYFKKYFIYLFLERGEGREEERERNIKVWKKHQLAASRMPPTGDLAHNPGMHPDWESNQWPFSSQAGTQPTEPHQPGLNLEFYTQPYIKMKSQERGLQMNRSWGNSLAADLHYKKC